MSTIDPDDLVHNDVGYFWTVLSMEEALAAVCPMTDEVCESPQCASAGCDAEREDELGEEL